MIYFLILVVLVGFSLVELYTGWSFKFSANKRLLWVCLSVFLMLFSGLRYKTGYDYEAYLDIFQEVGAAGTILNLFVEPLFAIVTILSYNLSGHYQSLLFTVAVLAIVPKFIFIRKNVELPFLALILYFSRYYLIYDMGQIRQGLAFVFILFALYPLVNRQPGRFLALVFIAATIHVSALCFLPLYYLGKLNLRSSVIYSLLGICFLAAVMDLKPVITTLASVLPVFISQKITFYLATEESIGVTFSMFFRLIIILTFAIYRVKIARIEPRSQYIFNIYFVGVCIYLFFNSVPQIGNRISAYFQIFEIMVVPYLFYITSDRWIRTAMFLFFVLYATWGINNTIHSIDDAFVPYKTIFSAD